MKLPLVTRRTLERTTALQAGAHAQELSTLTEQLTAMGARCQDLERQIAEQEEILSSLVDETRAELVAELTTERKQAYETMRHGGSRLEVRARLRLEGAVFGLNRAVEAVKRALPQAPTAGGGASNLCEGGVPGPPAPSRADAREIGTPKSGQEMVV